MKRSKPPCSSVSLKTLNVWKRILLRYRPTPSRKKDTKYIFSCLEFIFGSASSFYHFLHFPTTPFRIFCSLLDTIFPGLCLLAPVIYQVYVYLSPHNIWPESPKTGARLWHLCTVGILGSNIEIILWPNVHRRIYRTIGVLFGLAILISSYS